MFELSGINMAKAPIAVRPVTASPNPPCVNFENRAIGRDGASWPGATSFAASVAWMERSGIRGDEAAGFPYCAALHTGYHATNAQAFGPRAGLPQARAQVGQPM